MAVSVYVCSQSPQTWSLLSSLSRFHATRYPAVPKDIAHKFDPATHNHVVFIRNNRFFEVELAHPDGTELSMADLETYEFTFDYLHNKNLKTASDILVLSPKSFVRQICVKVPRSAPLRARTGTLGHTFVFLLSLSHHAKVLTWLQARQRLIEASPANEAALKRIESAMVVVALDNSNPTSREDLSWGTWVGDGRNRWYDKHQRMCVSCGLCACVLLIVYTAVIIWDNGRSGFLGEHSCMDGTPTLRMNEFMLGSLDAKKIDLGHPSPNVYPMPTKEIVLTANDAVLSDIKQAEKDFDELVGAHELRVLHYDAYGKDFVKQFKTSPDAWAQLVKQLAFYKLKGRPGVTYESAQTRKFQRGRTEVIRAASSESKAWVDAMVDLKATVRVFPVRDILHISWTGFLDRIRTYSVLCSSVVRLRAMCSFQRGPPMAKV